MSSIHFKRLARQSIAVLGCLLVHVGFAADVPDVETRFDWWSKGIHGVLGDGSVNGFADIWWSNKWGIEGERQVLDLDHEVLDESTRFSIDLKRRFFSLSDNSFFGIGAGWEEIDLENGDSSSGLRLTVEGRVGLGGNSYFYGRRSWLPELGDVGGFSYLQGRSLEIGVSFDPAPLFSLRFGFRSYQLSFDDVGGNSDSAQSEGFIFGAGFHW